LSTTLLHLLRSPIGTSRHIASPKTFSKFSLTLCVPRISYPPCARRNTRAMAGVEMPQRAFERGSNINVTQALGR
jgi:hypothetical protein